jgi:cytochrome c oxidase subunit 1
MFVAGISVYAALIFSLLSYAVAVPSAVKVFNWTATLYKGSIRYDAPMLYAFGFLGLFTMGGLTGLFLACLGIDVHVTDTYFVVAHFHYIMVGGALMGYLGGMHFWWPKISGRLYPRLGSPLSPVVFIHSTSFFPQFILRLPPWPAAPLLPVPAGIQVLNACSRPRKPPFSASATCCR